MPATANVPKMPARENVRPRKTLEPVVRHLFEIFTIFCSVPGMDLAEFPRRTLNKYFDKLFLMGAAILFYIMPDKSAQHYCRHKDVTLTKNKNIKKKLRILNNIESSTNY